ncbi:alkaline phosphatase [Actinoplanes sp. TBRC 11911]|uniref:esterase-like activity of phytase family protein n=1 Tax=Actinoplanes sp. TBRC 11911 TaxID=2729386 RepID=UPI00145DFC33|nr:esterase-like activity of phytase family protein [Actinoplanes sp. TBRC 11911]NMO53028.1 alkaline phosphatase [Actinoplanes sp. TBRC 11911]
MSIRRTTSALAVLGMTAAAALNVAPSTASAHGRDTEFKRLATFPAYLNSSIGDAAVAEISTVTEDGRTVVYTDSAGKRLGFVDITNPGSPKPKGTLDVGGEPTSVAHLGHLLLAGVNTSASFTDPSGKLLVVDDRSRAIVRSLDLGGQPDSVAVSPDGRYIAVVIENERDEDVDDGAIPQMPAGYLAVVDARAWKVSKVDLTGLAAIAPDDPEPEYVSINSRNEAIVSIQENNHFAVVSLASRKVVRSFPAGAVTVSGVDTKDDDTITLDGTITANREPDGVAWIGDDYFASANEGDYQGGTRGWSIFSRDGKVVWDAGNSLEHIAVEHGLYPDKRSDAKGIEPENVAYARINGTPYIFVNSERGNFTAVYDVSNPRSPRFQQLLPTAAGPEGVVAVPSRGLIVVSSETDDPDNNLRGAVGIYGIGHGQFPSIVSQRDIPWGTLSSLSAVPGTSSRLVSVTDAAYTPTHILNISVKSTPATIDGSLTVTKSGAPVGYDAEGIVARQGGGYWLAVEGSAATPNLLVRLDSRARVQQEIPLPADVAASVTTMGLEGVAEVGSSVYVAVQRPLKTDPQTVTRIGKYDTKSGTWSWLYYPLDTTSVGTVGLSEIVAVDRNTFAVIERDNQRGPQASIKRIYEFDVPATWSGVVTVKKRLVKDVLPRLQSDHGWVPDKIEGLAVAGNGQTYAVTDNDAVDDSTGETVFLRLGKLL